MSSSRPQAAELGFDDIEIGQVFELERSFSAEDVQAFAAVSGDHSPLHVDAEYASGTEFGRCVVHGILLSSLFSQLVGMRVPGKHALYLGQDLTFRRPVLVGESIRAIAKVTAKSEATSTLVLNTEIRSADDKVVVMGTAKVKVRDQVREPAAAPVVAAPVEPGQVRRVALVTGASRGMGAEIARTLARRGYAVAVNYFSSADRAEAVVSEIVQAGGVAAAFQADVRDAAAVQAMTAQVVEQLGTPTVLVNSAVGEFANRPITELRWADFEAHLDYQLKAVLNTCQSLQPLMKAAGGGAIVNLLSQVVGGAPATGLADYVSAKTALLGLSKAMAAEWADDGVRVNMVSPGLTRTEMTQHYHERIFKMEAARTPLKRIATTADVANSVAYLAGDDSAFMTGVNVFVTGGQTMI
ncbi:SDR family oxidoreductase [Pelomonas sp. SE-A7]|uniref:SDR family oxidoreductase n=1 Tax=Pelomonas sp. SE-A7 TaxID=3054953 RepID=UPI00259C8021|nr:SDR family oxidoreductase [Pelomonas sp. SE-A7]MDM4764891.1 SDR family oxidoreductase [Pelomonas sp. SE-A7]